jgi:hypothetical protein
MSTRTPERLEAAVDLADDSIRVRAGFRIVPGELLAGGPVELEFVVESSGLYPLQLEVSGDRMRQRPGLFRFTATFEGLPLKDPMAMAPYVGGPAGVVQVSTNNPWHQPLLLNQYVRLEDTARRLEQGSTGRIALACSRPLPLAATDTAALSHDRAPVVALELAFDLRRDDAAQAALVARLFDDVMQGPQSLRERPLALLLSMRSAASTEIDALTHHSDSSVAGRAHQVLAAF